MAGSKTQFLATVALEGVLGKDPGLTYAIPNTLYWVLSTAAFDPTATGDACNEATTEPNYARVSMTNDTGTWSAATQAYPSAKFNNGDHIFPTASSDYSNPILSLYIADSNSGGNLLYGADLSAPATITSGNAFKIEAGTFILNES